MPPSLFCSLHNFSHFLFDFQNAADDFKVKREVFEIGVILLKIYRPDNHHDDHTDDHDDHQEVKQKQARAD